MGMMSADEARYHLTMGMVSANNLCTYNPSQPRGREGNCVGARRAPLFSSP